MIHKYDKMGKKVSKGKQDRTSSNQLLYFLVHKMHRDFWLEILEKNND